MNEHVGLIPAIYAGWYAYQGALLKTLSPLDADQLALRSAPRMRSVGQIATHMIGARARWFYMLMGEGGDPFKSMGRWDRRGARARGAEELTGGLDATWKGMQTAINSWSPADWQVTWPGEDDSEPETITRQWVIWHLIEHDLHHGGEISITLGVHGLRGVNL